jgi:hypothetical protein
MRSVIPPLVALAALLAGCTTVGGVLDPTVAELEAAQGSAAAGDLAAIASRDVTCQPAEAGCARLREMKGDACLRLAQDSVAAGAAAAAAPHAACATEQFTALERAGVGDAASLGPRGLEAERLQRESASTTARARRANDALLSGAEAFARAFPSGAAGPYYAANALAWRVAFDRPADPCPVLAEAGTLAATAAARAAPGEVIDLREPAAAQVARLDAASSRAGCAR